MSDATIVRSGHIYEYSAAADPTKFVPGVLTLAFPAELHEHGPTRVIPFDLRTELKVDYEATSPNLMAYYLRILEGESLSTRACATSQAFYVIRGKGLTESEHGVIEWSEGDLFVLPMSEDKATHTASGDTAIYHITDEPLLAYLGVKPAVKKFEAVKFTKEAMLDRVEEIKHEEGSEHRNRLGVLLGINETEGTTKTLTHTLWSLLNCLPANTHQPPHRHQSVALDFAVNAPSEGVYTLMGPELDDNGWVKDPVRLDWAKHSAFVTPPGWWHSHHNETDDMCWVLPIQDAGLLTYQRALDITFSQPRTVFDPSSKPKPYDATKWVEEGHLPVEAGIKRGWIPVNPTKSQSTSSTSSNSTSSNKAKSLTTSHDSGDRKSVV